MKTLTLIATAAVFSAHAQESAGELAEKPEQAAIHFAGMGGIRDWRADGNRILFVEGRNRQWYKAELFGPCTGLEFEHAIGFVVESDDRFDRFSGVVVDGRVCRLKSLIKSEKPAGKSPDK